MPEVSIIIRTKNEERWINLCLKKIFSQSFSDFEVILVDNNSSDRTIEKAKEYKIAKILKIKKFKPGKALNLGIKKSKGKFIVCLSAHCIPVSKLWLKILVTTIKENKNYAGVYGRQEPMHFSKPSDIRDLLIVFGLDKKIQVKDSFFHNANSIIRKEILKKIPFNNDTTNIEDRLWGKEIIKKGYNIVYIPEASVYHYHGIHQDGNKERLSNVVNLIETHKLHKTKGRIDPTKLNIVAIIPVKGESIKYKNKTLLEYTIKAALKSKFVKKVIVSTDSIFTKKISKKMGAECPFIRPISYSKPKINLETVQKFSLNQIEKNKIYPDLIVHLEETFPLRTENIIDNMILRLLNDGYDSVIAAKKEPGWFWNEVSSKNFVRIDSGDVPRKYKEINLLGINGLCTVTFPEFIREGKFLGNNNGLFEIDYNFSTIEIRDQKSFEMCINIINYSREMKYLR